MHIITLDQIKDILSSLDLISMIEDGFRQYSSGQVIVPPVGELLLNKGEVHIKYGFIKKSAYYVIKIASGFYNNEALGIPSSNGMMLLFKQDTGQPEAILLDEGMLTDIRTAVAGAVVAKHLAPQEVSRIGIAGTGTQARLQLQYLQSVVTCRDVLVWGRDDTKLLTYQQHMQPFGFRIETAEDIKTLAKTCNLIITTTPSTAPLLHKSMIQPGTHITAVGSDTSHKQELDAHILASADIVVADSISQCLERGEIHQAIKAGLLTQELLVELGQVIDGRQESRSNDSQTTICDLTGVAVQDIVIATAVYRQFLKMKSED